MSCDPEGLGNFRTKKNDIIGGPKAPVTDNWIFRLHYKYSVALLILFGVLATLNQLFSNKIECTELKTLDVNFINQYCWSHSTYITVNITQDRTRETIYPGIVTRRDSDQKKFIYYYRWIPFVLFIQAIFMYLPRLLWRQFERALVDELYLDVNTKRLGHKKRKLVYWVIVKYLLTKPKIYFCNLYFFHVFTEILNLLIAIGQLIFMRYLFNIEFSKSSWNVFTDYYSETTMAQAFPKISNCEFIHFSENQVGQEIPTCLLPLNDLNEKIYLALWTWFKILILFDMLNMIYRFILSFDHETRCKVIRFHMSNMIFNLARDKLPYTVLRSTIEDWYLLDVLSKNVDSTMFEDILNEIYLEVQKKLLHL